MGMSAQGSRTEIGNGKIKPAKTNKRRFFSPVAPPKLQLTVLGLTSKWGLEVICYHRFCLHLTVSTPLFCVVFFILHNSKRYTEIMYNPKRGRKPSNVILGIYLSNVYILSFRKHKLHMQKMILLPL